MSNNFIYRVANQTHPGMRLMPENPSHPPFHGGAATSKGSAKAFYADDKKDTS